MKELFGNPVISFLIAVGSLIFAIYAWFSQRKIKEISLDYSSNDIIRQGKAPIPKLNIEFAGKPIQDLSSTTFYIWNSGRDVINCSDLVGETLKIKCELDAILDAQVIKQSDDSNYFSISALTSTEICLAFDYMNAGEGVRVQVLHTGSNLGWLLDNKIKGGRPIRNCRELRSRSQSGVRGILQALRPLTLLIAFFCMVGTMYICQLIGFLNDQTAWAISFLSCVVAIIAAALCWYIPARIARALHRTIPKVLEL